ncbi:MAG: DegV family protein [Pseudomonas sp.]
MINATLGSALDIKPVLRAWRGVTEPVAKLKGFESSVQKLFAFTARKVREGLLSPTVCVGYGGELGELRALPAIPRCAMPVANRAWNCSKA